MKKWIKWLIIIGIVAVCTVFFGSLVLTMLSYVLDFMGTIFGWLSTAVGWLGRVVDVFGFTGIFGASAEVGIIAQNNGLSISSVLRGGGF